MFFCAIGYTAPGRLAISAKSSTLGLGGELTAKIAPSVNARLGINALNFNLNGEVSNIDYGFGIDLLSFSALIDWYPFNNIFYLSGGILVNESNVGLQTTPTSPLTIGNTIYTPTEIGTLSGTLGFDNIAPYVGIGSGNAFGSGKRWGYVSEVGVAFIGAPNVSLSTTGTLAADPAFQADLATEREQLQNDLRNFKFFPVFSFYIYYRF